MPPWAMHHLKPGVNEVNQESSPESKSLKMPKGSHLFQHGLEWVAEPRFRDGLQIEKAQAMLDRFLAFKQRPENQREIVYALQN